jgi:ribulose-phosphate 3-epimerase
VHYEACTHLHRTLQQIKATGAKAGIALNPHTPVSVLEDIIDDVDMVCLMSVNPGFGGQAFIPQTYEKIRKLKKMISDNHSQTIIEIDGGVGLNNYKELIQAGADVLVAGNAVFAAENPSATVAKLKRR